MNKFLIITSTITSLSQAATFTTLDIATLELSETDTVNSTASIIDPVENTITTSYRFTSDYDGLGGDDTLSFDIVALFSGTDDGPQIGITPNAVNYIIEPGQTITYSLVNLSYTRAGGLPNSATFNGFYEISVGGAVVGDFTSIATGESYLGITGTGNSIMFDTFYPSFDLTLDPLATGAKFFRRPDANFTLETTIPEPTGVTLLGVGMLISLSRRHRNALQK